MSTPVDLSRLPPPDIVEALDFEVILAALKADFIARWPAFSTDLESDPVVKLLETAAYRELTVRQRVNDGARATMLATATGADLDNLAALLGVERLVVTPGDPPVLEPDADLRQRAALALEGYPSAGSAGAYRFHALSASGGVADVAILSPTPGTVRVAVLARAGYGVPDADLLAVVRAQLTADHVRPLTDTVEVVPAAVTPYAVTATLHVEPGPDIETVRRAAEGAVLAYAADRRRLGAYVATSGIAAALHQPGVRRVALLSPTADIAPAADGAGHCSAVTVSAEVAA